MYPILIEWGEFLLPAWHVMYALAAVAAFYLMSHLASRHHLELPRNAVANVFAISYIGGYFGARFLSILVEEEVAGAFEFMERLFVLGAMTFYGGALGAALLGTIYVKWRRLPFGTVFDLSIPAGLIALAIGRVGCFLNGDDWGKAIPAPLQADPPWWSVTFPNLNDGVARYPVQLISAGVVFTMVLFVVARYQALRKFFAPGGIGTLCVGAYACFRFLVEYLRDDPRGSVLGGALSTSQFISVCLIGVVGVLLPGMWRRRVTS